MPHAMTRAAAGSASRLAGTEATGSPPAWLSSSGATETWAARVTANGAASHGGNGR